MSELLTIGQVAARLGRSVDFIRKETDEGRLKAEPRNANGHRHYTESAVAAYEARAHSGVAQARIPNQPAARAIAPRVVRAPAPRFARPSEPPEYDPWLDEEPGPGGSTAAEQVHLNALILGGMREAPADLPAEWRIKLNGNLEEFVTIERFPWPESAQTAAASIRLRVDTFIAAFRETKKKEDERERARDAATRAAETRRLGLITYGRQLLNRELATWQWDDPSSEARSEVEMVLQAEVKADWDERQVRELVTEVIDQYEEEDDALENVDEIDDDERSELDD